MRKVEGLPKGAVGHEHYGHEMETDIGADYYFRICSGAICLAIVFIPQFGIVKGIWYSVFHAVSAFCNAGFDLLGIHAPYSSLTAFSDNTVINLTIMLLIIIGGIGFLTWEDVVTKKLQISRYRMQSKVILSVSAFLILMPAIYFYFYEFSGMIGKERVLNAVFQSVTARTAGFNAADLTKMSETGIILIAILMLIGGSPGSTAGGMKTTTVAVLIGNMTRVFQRKEHAHFFGRRVPEETVKNAAAILFMYLFLCVGGAMVISRAENLSMVTCLFETASAVGTVGLTLGITPELGTVSRIILILLMYLGRFGRHVAMKLHELGHQVLAVDKKESCVDTVLPYVTGAQIGDGTEEEFLASLGVRNFDVCIVAIGDDFQGSLETTSLLKELGAPFVVFRAAHDVHAKFLLKNGADEIVYPEKQLASWTAIRYSSDHIFDYVELDEDYAIFEIAVPSAWVGRTIGKLDLRRTYGINIMATKLDGRMNMNITADYAFSEDETILVLGKNKEIQKCFRI